MAATHSGLIKVKLLHRRGASVILPELLALGETGDQLIQPQFFYPPILALDGEASAARLWINALDRRREVDSGPILDVSFRHRDRLAVFDDHSEVYRCSIVTDHAPDDLIVGSARQRNDGGIDLKLYHHTADETLPLIRASQHVRGSPWNFQGVRKLENVAYAYFTSLQQIESEHDLRSVAMASDEPLGLRLDTTHEPTPDVVLDVMRGATRDRTAALGLWIPAEVISTPHVWMHNGFSVYYEVVHPWIYRVGLQPDQDLDFHDDAATPMPTALKRFDYAILGDCTTISGLVAPYDEEDTTETFHIQNLGGRTLFEFWAFHANTPLHRPPNEPPAFQA